MRPLTRLSLLVAIGATVLVQTPLLPAQQPITKQVEDLVNIDFRNDVRLFTVMCALNAAGFAAETEGRQTGWPRTELQAYFRQLSPQVVEPLSSFVTEHSGETPSETQASYTSLALTLKGPPDFELGVAEDQLPPDARIVRDFAKLLGPFWEQGHVGQLWQIYQPRYIQELERYRPVVRDIIRSTLAYFRIPARIVLDRQIVLIPDLMSMVEIVNARNLDKTYTIIVGPVADPVSNLAQLRHEYLHFLIDPLVEKHGARALSNRSLLDIAHQQPQVRDDYRDRFLLIVSESLIEALQVRLTPPDDVDSRIVTLFRRGLILIPHFLRELEAFEVDEKSSLPEAIPEMLDDIKESAVTQDLVRIEQLHATIEESEQAEEQRLNQNREAVQEANRRKDLLNQAGRLLSESRLGEATELIHKLLEVEPTNAHAHFYLGQIAWMKNDHARAFEFYSRVAKDVSAKPDVRAWSLVRMGLFLAAQGQLEQARAHFLQAASIDGDLRGAGKEAELRLSQLPPESVFVFKRHRDLGRLRETLSWGCH